MYLSSATNCSQGLKKKTLVQVLTFALFALGGLLAVVAVYQQFTTTAEPVASKPYAISKEEAIRIALIQVNKEPNRDAAFLPIEEATAKLVHVTDGGLAFIADGNSLADMWLYTKEDRFLNVYENKYLWHVDVFTSNNEGYRGYWYLIDANSGQAIGNDRDFAPFDIS